MTSKKTAETPAAHSDEEIAMRAYFIHLSEPDAHELENWLRAERELAQGLPPGSPSQSPQAQGNST